MGKRRALRPSGSAEISGDRKRRKNPGGFVALRDYYIENDSCYQL